MRNAVGDVLAHGAVEIGFQPVVDLVTREPVGFEALARGRVRQAPDGAGARCRTRPRVTAP